VGSLDIDANESDNTRDERGNGTRRYETSFSIASEGLLARAKVLSTRADDGNWANDGKQPMSTTVRQVKLLPGGADDGNWANDGKQPMSTTATQLYVPCRKKSKKHQVIDRWHQRLFHAAPKRLKQLAAAGLLPGVIPEDFKGYSTDTCEACLYGKMSKRPVPNKSRSKVRATRPGELIHCDIFGPSRVATISGRHRYFITFIDDFSGRLWLYLLKGRSDAAVALQRFAKDFQVATRGLRAMYYGIGSYVSDVSAVPTLSVIPAAGDGGNGATDALVPRQPEDQQPELDDGPDLISPPTKASSEELTAYWKKHGTKEEAWKLQPEKDLWISRGLPTTRKFNDGIWYTGKVTHIAIQKGKAQYGITYDDDNTTWFHHAGFIKKAHTNYAHRIGKTPHADRDGDDSDSDDSGSPEDSTTAPILVDTKDSVAAISLEDSETEGMDRTADLCRPHMHLYLRGWYRQVPWQMAYNIDGLASDILEPKTYGEACDHELSSHWKKAIKKEFGVMLTFDVWEVTPRSNLPPGVRPISTTWVFKAKPNADGTIERLKARLCARGFLQQYGKDFLNTFAPVARLSTIRLQVALSGRFGLKMRHLDFKSAFLQGKLDIPLYQELPEGWEDFLVPLLAEKGTKLQSTDVLRLKRGIYGLKQAAQLWYVALVKGLLECGFKQSKSDTCLFTMIDNKSSDVILITTWVDDCIVSYNNPKQWERILKMICGKFVLGSGTDFEWCLGMAVDRDMEKGTVCLHQSLYVRNLLKRFNMEDARVVRTPADSNVTLSKEMSPQTKGEMAEMERIPYRSLLGALLHLANFTRPDIACAVSICSRYANNYGLAHWQALKRILRYLRGTIDQKTGKSPGLLYDKRVTQDKPVIGYVDSDFARCPDSRKSMLGYVFICCGGPIQWKATKQSIIAASTAEAEYIALSEATKEAIWLRKLLKDFRIPVGAIPLYEDNQACIKILENPVYHARTKHIGIKVHLVRDYFEKGEIVVPYISTHEQLADIFTKPLPKATFEKFASRLVHWTIHRPWNNSKDITTLEEGDSPTPSSSKTVGAPKTKSSQSSTTQRHTIVSV